jgi:hypothetical protein
MLTVTYAEYNIKAPYAECHYAECRYAECRGAVKVNSLEQNFYIFFVNLSKMMWSKQVGTNS